MQPLADTLRRAPVPPSEAVELVAALADALASKVRDKSRPPRITPGTVLIEKRDDGTFAVEFKSGALPAPSGPVGADERAAVQELGVICYRLLTGKPPIKGNVGLIRDLEAAVSSSAQPDALKGLVLELISVDPARRPGLETAAERLVAIARGTPLPATGPAVPAPLPPPPRAGGGTRPPPTPKAMPTLPSAAPPSGKPSPPPITVQPIEPPPDLVPAAPVLPAEPIVVTSTGRSKKKKNATDTQERLFFAEGERLAAEERADAGIEGVAVDAAGDPTDIEVASIGGSRWRERRVLIAAGAGVALLALVLYVAFGRSSGGGGNGDDGDDAKTTEPLAAAATEPTQPTQPLDTAKVAAAPEPAAEPPAAAPEPPAAEPEPPAAAPAPEPVPEPEPAAEPAPEQPKAPKKPPSSSSSKSSKSSARSKAPPPPPPRPKEPPKPAASSDPLAQAKAARARGKSSEAYGYYAQAAKKNPAAGTFGMAEMAYAMKKYGDAISLAKKAMGKGASEKACWKIIAKSHCARNEGRSAWFAFSKAGGGDCP